MYRDRRNSCPTCRSILIHSGSVERCPDCAGCLVGEPVLREMVLGMTDGISEGDLEWEATEGGTPKMCPACRQAMTMVRMKDVTADRCGEHGFWFDPTELQTVLHATGETKGKPASQSFWQGLLSCLIESEEEEYRRFTETRRGHESFHEWRMRGRE